MWDFQQRGGEFHRSGFGHTVINRMGDKGEGGVKDFKNWVMSFITFMRS